MEYALILLAAVVTFGGCWLLDKGFTKKYRSAPQHQTGLSVRLNKHYCTAGIVLTVLGVMALFTDFGWIMVAGGCLLILTGLGFVVWYLTFGVYYDAESFLVCAFGKEAKTYRFGQIASQQLFTASGNTVIELYMDDGTSVQLHGGMEKVYPFLDHAFAAWCRQKGIRQEDCSFHAPANSCWFPPAEG